MTLLFISVITFFFSNELSTMYYYEDSRFQTSYQLIPEKYTDKDNLVRMDQFDDSFNFIFGISDANLNILDNRYFSVNIYELSDKANMVRHK